MHRFLNLLQEIYEGLGFIIQRICQFIFFIRFKSTSIAVKFEHKVLNGELYDESKVVVGKVNVNIVT